MLDDGSKVAYLMACWLGPRLNYDYPEYVDNRLLFLRYHIAKLEKLNHQLDTIFVLLSEWEGSGIAVNYYVDSLSEKIIGGANVEVIRRKNNGVSYGAYTDFFLSNRYREYDYLIMMEDDYVPILDNFDQTLVDILEEDRGTSFLCSMIGWGHNGGDKPHAGISNGIVRANAVALVNANNGFEHSKTKTDISAGGKYGQVMFSQAFLPHGELKDLRYRFKVPYLRINNLEEYFAENSQVLLAPYQWDVAHEV